MSRYRKLLVAVDGSAPSMHALKESFRLAANEKSWITVASVVPRYEGDIDLAYIKNLQSVLKQPCEAALAAANALAESSGALIKTVCVEGEVFERIVDLADSENYDLIVMGRTGRHPLARKLIGNVTARVIGHSRADVLVVPDGSPIGLERILVATDGSLYSGAAAFKALDLARAYGSVLSVVSIIDVLPEFYAVAPDMVDNIGRNARRYVEEVRKMAEAAGVKADTHVLEGEAAESITGLAGERMTGMIIMGSHGRTGLKRLLMGSVAENVIGHAPCPVIVVKSA
jgi:nucleotide-binding universal stress UspA family protein